MKTSFVHRRAFARPALLGGLVLATALATVSAQPPAARFAVLSDIHFYDARLGTSTESFEVYLAQDPKMLKESEAILNAALADIVQQNVKFVIVTGDLTKDGELWNHVRLAQYFRKLEQRGIQVFVIPGNHDINNSDALSYRREPPRPVPQVTPAMFCTLHKQFGVKEAIARDPASLSYVAEPVKDLWLLAIDSCKYDESKALGYPVVFGHIKSATMDWIRSVMAQAKEHGKQVIAFTHHGVNEHFMGEEQIFPDYLLDDWAQRSMQLADAGLRVVFTGHYHSQDSAYRLTQTGPDLRLCDIETSSLVMYPCAFRVASLQGGMLQVESRRITSIAAPTDGMFFQDFAAKFVQDRIPAIVIARLMEMFQLPQPQAAAVEPLVTQALIANYAGDEAPPEAVLSLIGGLIASPEPLHTLGLILAGLWTDLPPADATLTVPVL